ncbi:unannotated protein [freshwater metagenome]|uniref:Unannotated protein n=1 Tax=freshwater metagenome TaxID=449393 RepID=A0A6J5YG02_9ZZZZ
MQRRAPPARDDHEQDFEASPTTEATTSSAPNGGLLNTTTAEVEPGMATAVAGAVGGASRVTGPAMVTAPSPALFVDTAENRYSRPYSKPEIVQYPDTTVQNDDGCPTAEAVVEVMASALLMVMMALTEPFVDGNTKSCGALGRATGTTAVDSPDSTDVPARFVAVTLKR